MARERSSPSVVSVTEPGTHPYWTYRVTAHGTLEQLIDAPPVTRRQELPPVAAVNGALYFANASWLRASGALITAETLAYSMPRDRSVDLDTPLDWKFAEMLLKEKT